MRKEEGDDNDSATQSNDQEAETGAFSEAGLSLSPFAFGTTRASVTGDRLG